MAVSVTEHWKIDPDNAVFEPYYHIDSGAGPGRWHPLSHSPYTTPMVSYIAHTVEELNEWINH